MQKSEPHQNVNFFIFTVQYIQQGKEVGGKAEAASLCLSPWSRVPIKRMRSPGQSHKEPHHFSCRSRIKMLIFSFYSTYGKEKKSEARLEPHHFAFLELDPYPHQDDAEPGLEAQGAASFLLPGPHQSVNKCYFTIYCIQQRKDKVMLG
jgi:hypothetical protein